MNATMLFTINLVITGVFALMMLVEALSGAKASQPASLYWTFHKPLWRSLIEPESLLAFGGAMAAATIVWLL